MNKEGIHDKHTRLIALKPHLIGLEEIVLTTKGANIFKRPGMIIRQPDNLLFDYLSKTIYNVEYKTLITKSQRTHAWEQLDSCEYYLKKFFPSWRIKNLFVHDDYEVETR